MIDVEKLSVVPSAEITEQLKALVMQLMKMPLEERVTFLVATVVGAVILDSEDDIEILLDAIKAGIPEGKAGYLKAIGDHLRNSEQK